MHCCPLCDHPQLEKLEIKPADDTAIEHLLKHLRSGTNLTSFSLNGMSYEGYKIDKAIQDIATVLPSSPNLTFLQFYFGGVGDDDDGVRINIDSLRAIANVIPHLQNLITFSLDCFSVSDTGVEAIVDRLIESKSVTIVNLSCG